MTFTISEISRTDTEVVYGLYLDPAADPGSPGISAFTVELLFDSADLVFVLGSATYPSEFSFNRTNEDEANIGKVVFGGIGSAWTSFEDPLIAFKFDIVDADPSESISLPYIELEGTYPEPEILTIWTDNSAPTGSVTISGTVAEDQLLTASNTLADEDTLGTITYNWYVSGTASPVATGATYTPTQADVGKTITVTASYTDGDGKPESVTSAATAPVANTNDAPVDFIASFSGTVEEDSELTASASVTSDEDGLPDPLNFGYQWQSSADDSVWSDISGANAVTFTPGDNEAGKFVRVVASYTDGQGTLEEAASSSAQVTNINDVPVGFTADITGTVAENEELTADAVVTSDGDGLPDPLDFSYQWQSSSNGSTWTDITGATLSTFTPGGDEVGEFLRVAASYTDGQGAEETVNSPATAAVNAAPTGSVTISGTPEEDQELTAANTLDDVDGLGTITYTWFASGSASPLGTGSTYTLTQAEVDKTITVVASYTDGEGKDESVSSAPTGAVANVNDAPVGFSASVSGTPEQYTELSASASVTSDEDGLPDPLTFTYQWQSSGDGSLWSDITGATADTFTPTQAEVGLFIRVQAFYTDEQGMVESVDSPATAAVADVNDPPAGSVTISGTATEDQTLSVTDDLTDPDGLGTITYTWYASGTGTPLATGPDYMLTQGEVGRTITVVATYTDGQGNLETVISAPTGVVANVNDNPVGFTVAVNGTVEEDAELTAAAAVSSDEDGLPDPLTFSYQWQVSDDGAAWSDINGATAMSFTPGDAEVGKLLRVTASYTDAQGTVESVTSAATAAVANINDDPVGTVTFSGILTEDQQLTAANTLTDADGLGSISYTWYASGSATPVGTGPTYTLTQAEVGKTVTVVASYTDDGGMLESVSSDPSAVVANVNDLPAGFTASISGTATEDAVLTASAGVTADEDGLAEPVVFSYQWQSSADGVAWTDISGADSSTFAPGDAEVGKFVRVQASFTDEQGTVETTPSAATAAIANINDAPSGFTVDVTGSKSEGQTLNAVVGEITDADGTGILEYQWQRSDGIGGFDDIVGADSASYTLVAADVDQQLRLQVSYVDGQGTTESALSDPTSTITNTNDIPVGLPLLTGTFTEGETVSVDLSGISDGDGLPGLAEFSFQWQVSDNGGVSWSPVPGETGQNFELTDAESGKLVRVVVNYTDGGGTEESLSSASQAVANVNDAPTGEVLITGSPEEGETLTASNTLEDADGLGVITYTWYASGSGTPLATGPTYALTQAEVGKTITVVASYTDNGGTGESVPSAATAAVTNVNNAPTGSVDITGTAEEDQTLTASNTLADEDELGTVTYTWYASGSAEPLAVGPEVTLTQSEVGQTISVVASYLDGQGKEESVTSASTAVVANVNDLPGGSVTISGPTAAGETLSASNTITDEDGVGTITYTWFASGSAIPIGTGATYTLTQAEAGKTVTAVASYTDDQGTDESVTSLPTAEINDFNNPPSGTVIVFGNAFVGVELTAFNNLTDPDFIGPISYQWLADGELIDGATGSTYQPVLTDKGKSISVIASYLDGKGYAEAVESAATDPVTNPGDLIEGTPLADTLSGGEKDDTIVGFDGRDTLQGNGGDDLLQGDGDIDTAVFTGALVDYSRVRADNEITVTGPFSDGIDELIDLERLQFTDMSVAYDLDGNAGRIAKLLGVMLGADDWYDRELVGIGLDIFDNFDLSFEEVMDLAFSVIIGPNPTNTQVVNLIYVNLVGQDPPPGELNALTADLLGSGQFTQGQLGVFAAEFELNTDNIGLVGLIDSGLEYLPI